MTLDIFDHWFLFNLHIWSILKEFFIDYDELAMVDLNISLLYKSFTAFFSTFFNLIAHNFLI